ncbi:MAG TPA: hypothetical protein VEA40_00465 [Ramlibacter sp.]|nr:hypothetical protein [Ramlibacter sp.]
MPLRPFFDTLRDCRPDLPDDLGKQMQELVHAVTATGKAGSIRLTLEVRPLKGSTEAVVLKDAIVLKKPVHDNKGTVMFPTVEGNLQRSNPNQRDLPGLSVAGSEPGERRTGTS